MLYLPIVFARRLQYLSAAIADAPSVNVTADLARVTHHGETNTYRPPSSLMLDPQWAHT